MAGGAVDHPAEIDAGARNLKKNTYDEKAGGKGKRKKKKKKPHTHRLAPLTMNGPRLLRPYQGEYLNL
jgi:hypothetical protein